MSRWTDHYENKLNDKYKRYINKRYAPFIVEISSYIIDNNCRKLAELGCGIGSITYAISDMLKFTKELQHELIDNDVEMIKLAWINLHNKIGDPGLLSWSKWDIKSPYVFKKFDLVHSHGVLEHFVDEDIFNITQYYKDVPQFHYVPGNKYTTKTMGDERLLPKEYWEELTGMKVITFNDGYDYILSNRL